VHRFLPSGMVSELASDSIQSNRIFAGSTRNCLDSGVAPGLLFKPVFKDINSTVAGIAGKRSSFFDYWFGGVFMLLKLIVLSSASLTLWLVPLVGLDKKVGWHKGIQGASLCAAVACAVTGGNIARKQSEQEEIEAIKTRAITADVIDEISTSAYISQQQRQQEAEQILNPVEHLERALALTYDDDERSEPIAQNQLAEPEQNGSENGESERTERIHQLQAKGWGKAKIILEIWGVTKGGSPKYKAAEAEYKRLIQEEGGF
jgi:hypothetical protein